MVPELGQFALILAFCFACAQAVLPMVGYSMRDRRLLLLAKPLVFAQFFFIIIAFTFLIHAFVSDDFSVAYVANNSSEWLPVIYKISAVWGGHEGSLLLWAVILSAWGLAFSLKSQPFDGWIVSLCLSALGMVSVGFLGLMLFTSNPFERWLLAPPVQGVDLNPLLQDFGLIIHPPLLYSGYVGFSIPFAFAIAILVTGRFDEALVRWIRPWTLIAWGFLTLGIALGSWWAYYELGWGGWWFWDPVENASLLPWLSGTALLHSLVVTERRGLFKKWTLLLAISTFSLSLLGTFMVRSGVLTSVHAFAADPERGSFILAFLVFIVGCSLSLFALRAPVLSAKGFFNLLSAEALLLLNNVLLITACSTVLLGTLFPLIAEAAGIGKLSVGAPYFNALFVPLAWLTAFTLGVGITAHWKKNTLSYLYSQLLWVFIAALVVGSVIALWQRVFEPAVAITFCLSLWIVLATVNDIVRRLRHRSYVLSALFKIRPTVWAMHLAHIGIAVAMIGIVMSAYYSVEKDVRMQPGDSVTVGKYTFKMQDLLKKQQHNYSSTYATIVVEKRGEPVAVMHPEKRFFFIHGTAMTEVAIDPGFTRDLYIALGEPLADDAWAVRIQIKSFIRWIWSGAILMVLGSVISVLDRRYLFYNGKKNQGVSDQLITNKISEEAVLGSMASTDSKLA